MIEVRNVFKSFGDKEVLHDIGFSVEKGDVIAILGPSGSGKTTLLRCMNYLENADSGELVFDGKVYDLHHSTKHEIAALRKRTGFVFQEYNLFLNMTAVQNVMEGLVTARKVDKKEAKERALKALDHVGLLEHADKYPHQLSGGQKQRVAIARAIVTEPEIIYFDEPTSALDPELTGEVLQVMKELAEDGMTMLVVTHEMTFARNVAKKIIFMDHSRIVEEAEAQEFFDHPKTERTKAFINGLID